MVIEVRGWNKGTKNIPGTIPVTFHHLSKASICVALKSFMELGLLKILAEVDNSTSHKVQEKTKFLRCFPSGTCWESAVVTLEVLVDFQVMAASQSDISFEFYNPKKTNTIVVQLSFLERQRG